MSAPQTLLKNLIKKLHDCNVSSDAEVDPVAILWSDPNREWQSLTTSLLSELPELFIHGDYAPERRHGPSLWLRYVVDCPVAASVIPEGRIPILYLPGISSQKLRSGQDRPWDWEPLVELMFRGTLWLQPNGRDWTLQAFFNSLGLDMAEDQVTTEAARRSLTELATIPLRQLRETHLEASYFDALLAEDPIRDLLSWMSDPQGFQRKCTHERWTALCSQWKQKFRFEPGQDGELAAAEKLARGDSAWEPVWQRFVEAPNRFSGIKDLMQRAAPGQMGLNLGIAQDLSRWPQHNEAEEQAALEALRQLPQLPHAEACRRICSLEECHAQRRGWVWAQLGQSAIAQLLDPLGRLAQRASQPLVGTTPSDFMEAYIANGWEADAAAWQAVATAGPAHQAMVKAAVAALLLPWLDETARRFQQAVTTYGLPTPIDQDCNAIEPGGCLVFADGLRYDLAWQLRQRLEKMGMVGKLTSRWAALPSVTATAKPAVAPISRQIRGTALLEDFAPQMMSGKIASATELRKAIVAEGYQILDSNGLNPQSRESSRGWLEVGDLDHRGHQLQDDLPDVIKSEIKKLALQTQKLFNAGWTSVRLVTDHGWLYCPGGLPTVSLPKHLTTSKWARCATIKGQSQVNVPTVPWSWNPGESFATPPGAACFRTGSTCSYAHGGLSIQECLTPVLEVSRGSSSTANPTIVSIAWYGLRCSVKVANGCKGLKADLRRDNACGSSVTTTAKAIKNGNVRLLVEDEDLEGLLLVLVLLGADGRVITQQQTRVGDNG